MSDADSTVINAPVEFAITDDGDVSLKFGPMPIDHLVELLVNLGTEDGQRDFLSNLKDALEKEVQNREQQSG